MKALKALKALFLSEKELTGRVYLALAYSIIVFQPASLWLYLVTFNIALFASVQWATLILAVELARFSGKPLSKQEASIVFLVSSWAYSGSLLWLNLIYAAYFKNSPIARTFNISDVIPSFYAPPSSLAWMSRTFFHQDWVLPILVFLGSLLLAIVSNISLGLITRQLFIKVEKLPFPYQQPMVQGIITTTERDEKKIRVFTLSAFVSMAYSLLLYGLPFTLGVFGYTFQPIPIPWIDLNRGLHSLIPGASFGIATDFVLLSIGFLIPLKICLSLFIGSFVLYFLGNWFVVSNNITTFAKQWVPGMSVATSWQRSTLYVWISPLIGIAVAAGLMPIIRRPKALLSLFKPIKKEGIEEKGDFSVTMLLAMYILSAFGSTILAYFLAPDFPLWLFALLSVGWSFIATLVITRAIGRTGMLFSVPYIKEMSFMASGYRGYNAWFVPLYLGTGPTAAPVEWCTWFKISDACGAKPKTLIKAWLFTFPFGMIFSFFIVSRFWSISPIPSAAYPGSEVFWPVSAIYQSLWISRTIRVFRPTLVGYGFVIVAALYLVFDVLHVPISMIAVAAGCASPIPYTFTMLLGGVLAKFLERLFGRKWWNNNKAIACAGIALGTGLIIVVASAIAMIVKAAGFMPY